MKYLVSAMLIVVGVIHLLPLSGALGSERLTSLYGLDFKEENLEILMRHRAVLFGLLGAFMVYAAFRPAYQTIAFVGGFISVLSFLYLACGAVMRACGNTLTPMLITGGGIVANIVLAPLFIR